MVRFVLKCRCTVGCLQWGVTITFQWWDLSRGVWAKIGALCSFVCVRCKITVGHRVKRQTFLVEFYELWQCLLRSWHALGKQGGRKRFLHLLFLNDTVRLLATEERWVWTEKLAWVLVKNIWIRWISSDVFRNYQNHRLLYILELIFRRWLVGCNNYTSSHFSCRFVRYGCLLLEMFCYVRQLCDQIAVIVDLFSWLLKLQWNVNTISQKLCHFA